MTVEIDQRHALRLQLAMIAGNEPPASFIEIRALRPERQAFVPVGDITRAADTVLDVGAHQDVYIGAAPRTARRGTKAAIERVWAIWCDCDTPSAVRALAAVRPLPTMVIRSGTLGHRHAWWALSAPLSPDQARAANRKLAHTLGADMASTDAARIMRAPGTLNWKHDPPPPVTCTRLELDVHTADQVVGDLPEPDPEPPRSARVVPINGADPLLGIPAEAYIPALTGRSVGSDGKVQCPFHSDGNERTPSLHIYGDRWACFGCPPVPWSHASADYAGGSIIDFGALLYGLTPRGAQYVEIRKRLASDLLRGAA